MASKKTRKGGGRPATPSAPSSDPTHPDHDRAAPLTATPTGPAVPPTDTGRSSSRGGSSSPVSPPGRPWALWVLMAALLGGLGVAIYLTRLHLDLSYGEGSFTSRCDFGAGFNCTEVIGSTHARLFGKLPLSVLAIPAYAVMLMLTLRGRSPGDRKALGLVTVLGLISTLFSVWLFYVSKVLIGSFCPFCMSMYAVNLLALVLPAVALRERLGAMLKYGVASIADRRLMMATVACAALVSAMAWGSYSATRDQLVAQSTSKILGTPAASGAAPVPGAGQPSASSGSSPSASTAARSTSGEKRNVPIDESVAVRGPADAPVTLVVYEDFQCGFCKRLSGNLELLLEKYPKTVKFAFRHFPMNKDCNDAPIARSMHPDACRASIAAECARQQGKFWPYYDLVFKNSNNLGASDLTAYAQTTGLDLAAFGACQRSPAALEKIKEDTRTGAALGISGTPALYINGRSFAGAQSVEVLSAVIEAEQRGETLTAAQLREIPPATDLVGPVKAPETVKLTGPEGPFEMDAFEASIVGGKAVSRTGATAVTNVTWFEADTACRASGKRLCTHAEWFTACQGATPIDANHNGDYLDDPLSGSSYPYGDHYRAGYCNDQVQPPKDARADAPPPVPPLITGNRPECRSKAGVYDLTGSVREWVGTVAPRSAYVGGAFYSGPDAACGSRNESVGPFYEHETTGFRCCSGGTVTEKADRPGRQVGDRLAPFTATTLDGKKFDSASLKGKVTLLTFWASWCGPCRKELPAYASIYPELEKKGFQIIAVNVDENAEKARAFLSQIPVNFPVVMDTYNVLLESFETRGMPTSFLIDKDGRIRQRKTGFDTGDEKRLQKTVEGLLGG